MDAGRWYRADEPIVAQREHLQLRERRQVDDCASDGIVAQIELREIGEQS